MAGWDEVIKEIEAVPTQLDNVRRKYIKALSEYTGRSTIAYYSSFLNKNVENIEVNDYDLNGFMNAIRELDCSKGLDLILHTPGGDPTAAEAIVEYIKDKFDKNIRVIVPQIAMSAGTMIACSAKEIIMGRKSSLGPIDPQFNGIPAENILKEFKDAKDDLSMHPENAQYWAIKLQQYPAAFMKTAIDAIELSNELIEKWLGDVMLKDNSEKLKKAVDFLSSHSNSKVHGRHYRYDQCMEHGLKVTLLEDDDKLQDLVLSLHHCYIISFENSNAVKMISSDSGKDFITHLKM